MTYSRLNPPLSGLLAKRELTTDAQSMTADAGGQQGSIALPAVTGYTIVGALDVECSAWQLPVTKSFCTTANWYWAVSNPKGWGGSYTVHVRLLYARTDAV